MTRTLSLFARAALGLAAALLAPLLVVPAAHAAPDGDITWAVTPADESGPDDRGVVEQELDPGQSRDDFLAVRNLSLTEVTFTLSSADGYYTENGRFNMLPSDQESVDAGLWIDLPDTVTVAPNATAVVPFRTTVPDDAIPGDHAAGIAASVTSTGTDEGGSQVGVESRVGFRVLTRVTGDIVPAFAVDGVRSGYDLSWNPFQPGTATTTFTVRNTGNASLSLMGDVTAGTGATAFPGVDAQRQELLPGEERTFSVTVPDVWPTFYVPGAVALAPTASDLGGEPVAVTPASTDAPVWAIPLPQLLVLLGVALIVAALFWRRRRFTAALDRAREEGRASAGAPAATADRLPATVGASAAPSLSPSAATDSRRTRREPAPHRTTEPS